MSKERTLDDRLARIKAMAEKAETARIALEKEVQEARAQAAELIPKIKGEMAEIDGEVTKLQQRKTSLIEQLRLLGEKVSAKGRVGKRGGGMADKFKEMLQNLGVGATFTNKDVNDYLGSSSGYVGMIITAQLEAGNVQRTGPGEYKIVAVA